MSETGAKKRIHKLRPFTGRPAGIPKCPCEDDVRNGLKKTKQLCYTTLLVVFTC